MSKIIQFFRRKFSKQAANKPSTASAVTCSAMQIYRPPQMLNVIVISPMGMRVSFDDLPPDTTGIQLKQMAIDAFLARNELRYFAASASKLARRYAIVHARTGSRLHEKQTLIASDVYTADELCLTVKPMPVSTRRRGPELRAPTQEDIAAATAQMPAIVPHRTVPTVLSELVKSVDIQTVIKNLVYQAAKMSAYVIGGNGRLAAGLIASLQKQLAYDLKVGGTGVAEGLQELGYDADVVAKALTHSGSNDFSVCIKWLTENAPFDNIERSSRARNTQTLLEIVRLYKREDLKAVPAPRLLALIEMGFEVEAIAEAMDVTHNNVGLAIEWMCGDRSRALEEVENGFTADSPILRQLMANAKFHLNLGSPKSFLSYLSILADYRSIALWFQNEETAQSVMFMLNTFYDEKNIQSTDRVSAFLW